MQRLHRYLPRSALGAAVLLGGLIAGQGLARPAHAQISVCRDDPQLWLSNGHKVQVIFSLPNTDNVINSVQAIHYDIHIPAGATVMSWNHPSSLFSGRSSWTISADAAPGEYEVVGEVDTNASPVPATLSQQVVPQTDKVSGSSVTSSVTGTTNQQLTVDQTNVP